MILPWSISVASVVALVWFETHGQRQWRWLFKPLAALCFIWLAILCGATDSVYGQWLLLGLLLCLGGDVLLIPDSDKAFTAGLGSFLLGHLAYAVAFMQVGLSVSGLLVSLPLAGALGLLSWRWLMPHLPADMKIPVAAYIVVIGLMLVAAGGAFDSQAGLWIVVGAWGFALSDLAVARQQFVKTEPLNRYWGTPLYFFAQMLLASTPAIL